MKKSFLNLIIFFVVSLIFLGAAQSVKGEKKPIELRWGIEQVLADLDPNKCSANWQYMAVNNMYDTLVFPDQEKGYIPWIAKSWDISSDKKTYTFYLKQGIPFHDGTEITAEDVAFSMDRMLKMRGPVAGYFKAVKPGTSKVIDKFTVQFNLSRKDPAFMHSLFLFKILNKKLVLKNKAAGEYGEFGDYGIAFLQKQDAGSGPYMLDEHKHADFLRMKRFEKYPFAEWKPNSIDIATLYMIPEMVTIATKLRKGELEMVTWVLPVTIAREIEKDKNFIVDWDYLDAALSMTMNNKKKPFDDPYVRKAVAHAWDLNTIKTQILAGGETLKGPIPGSMRGGCEDIVSYPFDLEKAKEMLKKSKYSAEELQKFNFEIAAVAGSERFGKIALLTSLNLKKIGLNASVKTARWSDICQRMRKPETAFDFAIYWLTAKVPHPYMFLIFYTPDGWGTAYPAGGIYYENPKVTEAVRKGNDSLDIEEQRKYYCEAQEEIAEDCPAVFSNSMLRPLPYWRYVKGYKHPVGSMYFDLRYDRYTIDTEDPLFRKNQGW